MLQALVLGQILENPEELRSVRPDDFADPDLRRIIGALQNDDTRPLAEWLWARGVDWRGGRAIESVREVVRLQGRKARAESVRKRARWLLSDDPETLREQLKRLEADIGGEEDRGDQEAERQS